MKARTPVPVFPSDVLRLDDVDTPLAAMLADGDECYTLDGGIAFLRTGVGIGTLTSRSAERGFGDRQALLTDATGADRAGPMTPAFRARVPSTVRRAEAARC